MYKNVKLALKNMIMYLPQVRSSWAGPEQAGGSRSTEHDRCRIPLPTSAWQLFDHSAQSLQVGKMQLVFLPSGVIFETGI